MASKADKNALTRVVGNTAVPQLDAIDYELSNLNQRREVYIGHSTGKVYFLLEDKAKLRSQIKKKLASAS